MRKNMKPVQRTPFDQALLRHRSLIETVFDELKKLSQVEHTRHRSHDNFMINLMVMAGSILSGAQQAPLAFDFLSSSMRG